VPSGSIDFHVDGDFADGIARLQSLPERIDAAMIRATGRGTDHGEEQYRDFINKDTGRTAGTIQSSHEGMTGYWGSDDEVARYLEYGTSAHTIEGNPALFWGGISHPVRRVNHPGTPEFAPLLRSGEASVGAIEAIYVEEIEAAFG
jgi:hypothetical protein